MQNNLLETRLPTITLTYDGPRYAYEVWIALRGAKDAGMKRFFSDNPLAAQECACEAVKNANEFDELIEEGATLDLWVDRHDLREGHTWHEAVKGSVASFRAIAKHRHKLTIQNEQ